MRYIINQNLTKDNRTNLVKVSEKNLFFLSLKEWSDTEISSIVDSSNLKSELLKEWSDTEIFEIKL